MSYESDKMLRVAVVGRPNVGKSTLFNRLCGKRKSIVGNESGITRDRIYGVSHWRGVAMEIIDTGGMIPNAVEIIPAKVLEQVQAAIRESDLLLFVVDGRVGATPLDEQLLPILRRFGLPVWVVVNKLDTPELEAQAAPFYSFGFEHVFSVSAEHSLGIADLLDALVSRPGSGPAATEQDVEKQIALAVVGRPNVGKSSLVNRLLGAERTIVSEIPGTTRDAVDTCLVRDGVTYRIIDTAGIRRKGKTEARTEKMGVLMAKKNLQRADVAVLLLDAVEGVTKLDAAIGGYCCDSGCSVIIVLNKWDLVQKDQHTLKEHTDSIVRRMKYLSFAPILTVSALSGMRVSRLFELIRNAYDARLQRIPTGTLNNVFVPDLARRLVADNPAHKPAIRYMTQVRAAAPTFVVFTSGRKPLHFSAERYLVNQLRERFGFYATPIRIVQRVKAPGK